MGWGRARLRHCHGATSSGRVQADRHGGWLERGRAMRQRGRGRTEGRAREGERGRAARMITRTAAHGSTATPTRSPTTVTVMEAAIATPSRGVSMSRHLHATRDARDRSSSRGCSSASGSGSGAGVVTACRRPPHCAHRPPRSHHQRCAPLHGQLPAPHALAVRVPEVLDAVVRPARKVLGNERPLVPIPGHGDKERGGGVA